MTIRPTPGKRLIRRGTDPLATSFFMLNSVLLRMNEQGVATSTTSTGGVECWKRPRFLLLVACLAAALGTLIASRRADPEPTCQGRNLSEWLKLYERDHRHDSAAYDALKQIGTRALPFLLRFSNALWQCGALRLSPRRSYVRLRFLFGFAFLSAPGRHIHLRGRRTSGARARFDEHDFRTFRCDIEGQSKRWPRGLRRDVDRSQ